MSKSKTKSLPLDERSLSLVRRLLATYVRPHLWRIAAALLCMAVVAASTAAFTQLMKPIINDIFVNKREEMLLPIALGALVVFTAKGVATYGQAVLMSHVGFRIVADMQRDMYRKLMDTELAFFNETSPGKLVSRFIHDVQMLRNAVSNTLTGLGKDTLTLAALVGVMFYEDWILAAIAFLAFPTAILPIQRIGKRMRKVSGNTQEEMGRLTTLLDETFQGARHVKAYNMERHEAARAEEAIDGVFALMLKGSRTRNALHPIMEVLGGLAVVGVIGYGGSQVIAGNRDPGTFFAFITALLLAYEPLKRLAKLNANLQEGLAAAQRVFALIDRPPRLTEKPDAAELKVTQGEVRLENVSFTYNGEDEEKALHDVTLAAPAGKTCALVGASGAGKSTVLNLIPRFFDVTGGAVTIDGQDVRDVTLHSLRDSLALVSQEVMLFDDTVRANIAYGRPDASSADIESAARAAGADDFIAALPEGYDTLVGPRGTRLSGGQRQRIAIARAMLRDAPILLLDEATSALDTESERKVQRALGTLMKGRTAIVIAHRLSTVMDAEVIYVMDKGRVVEQGSHAELLARGGAYARLYAMQFADEGEREAADLRAQA
ncbi:ABC transporter ATP-binding protein [Ferruginivarius sediminum]|nr:ABC transporter ATP-binding protein [Ferruginivarius sediminum]